MESCAECDRPLDKKPRREKIFSNGIWFCTACYKTKRRSESVPVPKKTVPKITLPIKCTVKSARECIFLCKGVREPNLIRIPKSLRSEILLEKRIIIPEVSRCCKNHIQNDKFTEKSLDLLLNGHLLKDANLSAIEWVALIDDLREKAKITAENECPDEDFFDETERLSTWTGLERPQFNELATYVKCEKKGVKITLLLGVFLMYMYTSLSESKIGAFLGLSQATVSRYINITRESLLSTFVPTFLNVTREKVRSETSNIARTLHKFSENEDKTLTVWDGTYIYLDKSNNFQFQKATYSGHKKTNYVKPMLVVTSNGYIVNVLGPDQFWAGSVGDAYILASVMKTPWFTAFFKAGDIFVVDRGFDRCVDNLKTQGFEVSIPVSQSGQKQLTALEANKSRLCTKIRWIVEWVNSSLKRFKYVDGKVGSYGIPHLFDNVRILAAIHNSFFSRQYSDSDNVEVATKMLARMETPNLLQALVEKENLTRKMSMFEPLGPDRYNLLPPWTIQDLTSFSTSFQLRLVRGYIANHFAKRKHEFQICRDEFSPNFRKYEITVRTPIFIRARLLSRHISSKVYYIFILIDVTNPQHVPPQSVKEAYCTCKTGSRTVSVCVHAASILWYVFYGRHEECIRTPAAYLDKCFLLPSMDVPSDVDVDVDVEDEEEQADF